MADKTLRPEKYTNAARQILAAAQQLADEQKHAELTPLHLLARLLEGDRGVLEVFRKAGADPKEVRGLCELSLRGMPKETSGAARLSSHMMDLLVRAEREAERDKAELVGIDHLLHALAQEIRGLTGEVLSAQRIGPGAFRPHVSVLQQGGIEAKVDEQTAHKTLPLESYTSDAQQILAAAQQLADEQKHAELTPLHLLARLLERDHGVLEIFREAGADPNEVRHFSELSLRRMPKQAGGVAYLSSSMEDLLDRATREAQRDKAELVGIEHLLHALPTQEFLRDLPPRHDELVDRMKRRHGARQNARLETTETSFRLIAGALRSHVCASFVWRTRAFGEAWVGLREDARALGWARAPLGGTRSSEADSAAADALSVVAHALMLRGDRAEAHRTWSEAFDALSCSAPSCLLALVAKAPLSDASVFDSAQKRVMKRQSNLSGGAAGAWLALRAQTTMPREQREHLAQRAAWVLDSERPRLGNNEENLAQSAIACALVALGKSGLLPKVSPLAIELAEAARTPTEGMRPGLREELAARALEITGESSPGGGMNRDDQSAGGFAERAYDAFVRGGEANDAARADFEQAKLRWSDFVMDCDDGLIDSTELASARTNLAILSAVFNEREQTIALLRQIGTDAQAECEAELVRTKSALAAVAEGKPLALAVVSALDTKAMSPDVMRKALEKWSNASTRSELSKERRYADMILAEVRARFAAGDARGASDLIDVVLAKTGPDGRLPDALSVPEVLYTMIVLGRAKEAMQLAADEQYPRALAAQTVALLALGDNEAARICMSEATNGPIRLVDSLEIAVGLVGVMEDPRASASALLGEIAAGEAAILSMIPS